MRKATKVLHTLAASGLIGGVLAYMVLLLALTPATQAAYAELRSAIAALSNYVLLPSLALGLVSGLLSMVVHRPFLDKGWVWLKAALGILMFKGVLTLIGAKANHAADVSRAIADGSATAEAVGGAVAFEWATLVVIMAVSFANVVLGVWRPALARRRQRSASEVTPSFRPGVAQARGSGARPAFHRPVRAATAPNGLVRRPAANTANQRVAAGQAEPAE